MVSFLNYCLIGSKPLLCICFDDANIVFQPIFRHPTGLFKVILVVFVLDKCNMPWLLYLSTHGDGVHFLRDDNTIPVLRNHSLRLVMLVEKRYKICDDKFTIYADFTLDTTVCAVFLRCFAASVFKLG